MRCPPCRPLPLTLILISETQTTLKEKLLARARDEGFADFKVTAARLPAEIARNLEGFIAAEHHGEMGWMEDTLQRRVSPDAMWPEAKSAIMLAAPYGQGLDPFARLQQKSTGVISTYALNRDYHDVVKGRLKRLAQWFATASGHEVKVFVDTAPLMEKPLAAQAGLGWQGKHTNLLSRQLGSWFFIGSILTTAELEADQAEDDHCGSCRACLDICPTKAFDGPRRIDARRCISYLTIEHKGEIAEEFRAAIGNRIYGCDDCLAICPWNKFAEISHEAKFAARADLVAPELAELLALDDAAFRTKFSGSPIKRIGRDSFMRNCLIAAGNSGDKNLVPSVRPHLQDKNKIVSDMALWALQRLEAVS